MVLCPDCYLNRGTCKGRKQGCDFSLLVTIDISTLFTFLFMVPSYSSFYVLHSLFDEAFLQVHHPTYYLLHSIHDYMLCPYLVWPFFTISTHYDLTHHDSRVPKCRRNPSNFAHRFCLSKIFLARTFLSLVLKNDRTFAKQNFKLSASNDAAR